MEENEDSLSKLSRLEICMVMHENSFEFTDHANQQNAVLNHILEKLKVPIEEIGELAAINLKESVRTLVNFLIKRYKANSKHIERLVSEDFMGKGLPDSLKSSLMSVLTTRAPYNRQTEKKAF